MNNQERIAKFIQEFPGRNDDEIAAVLRIQPRQTVNQICRALARAGKVERRPGPSGKLANYPKLGGSPREVVRPDTVHTAPAPATTSDATLDWYWEGNVTTSLASWLEQAGWTILSQADTRSRQQGLDLHATRGGRELVVEVKGYPSRIYRNPARAAETKPTDPTSQAQQWYSHALLKALRLQHAYPSALVMMGFPDFPRYRALFRETRCALERLQVAVVLIDENGEVEVHGLED